MMSIDPRDLPHKTRVLRNIALMVERGEFARIVRDELRAEGLPEHSVTDLHDPKDTAERIRLVAGEIETP